MQIRKGIFQPHNANSYNYFLTTNAKIDLQEIWNYTFEEWGEPHADEYTMYV